MNSAIAVRYDSVVAVREDPLAEREPCPTITRWLAWLPDVYETIVLAGIAPDEDGEDEMFSVLEDAGLDDARLIRPPQPIGGHRPEKEWRAAILDAIETSAEDPVDLFGYVGNGSVDRQAALAAGVTYRAVSPLRRELAGRSFLLGTGR